LEGHVYALVAIGILTVGAEFYYYLKVVRAMYWLEPAAEKPPPGRIVDEDHGWSSHDADLRLRRIPAAGAEELRGPAPPAVASR
jgi:hypothetical protein